MKTIKFIKNACGTFCYMFRQGKVISIRYFSPFDERNVPECVLEWIKEG